MEGRHTDRYLAEANGKGYLTATFTLQAAGSTGGSAVEAGLRGGDAGCTAPSEAAEVAGPGSNWLRRRLKVSTPRSGSAGGSGASGGRVAEARVDGALGTAGWDEAKLRVDPVTLPSARTLLRMPGGWSCCRHTSITDGNL